MSERARTVKSFEELGPAYGESLVPRPELPEITDLTTDEAVLQRLQEGAGEVRRWTTSTLAQLDTLAQAPRELQEYNEEKIAEAKQALQEYLDAEVKAWRRACWLGIFEHRLAVTVRSKAEAQAVIASLVRDGLLENVAEGPLNIFGGVYTVPARSTFGDPEAKEVTGLIHQFIGRALQADREVRTKQAEELYGQSELSLEEFLSGKAGRITLGVPPQQVLDRDDNPVLNEDGSPRWRGGGTLLVESDGKRVLPIGASGNIQRGVQEAMRLEVHVLHYSLGWEFISRPQQLDEERASKLVLLWNLIKRGIVAERRNLEIRAQKAKLTEGVELLSMKEFFIDGQPGICLVELGKPWEPFANSGQSVYIQDLFFMVKRSVQEGESEEDNQSFVSIVEVPPHVAEYLSSCMGDHPEGEKFGGCPQPLRAILQAAFGRVSKEEFLAEKYGRR